MSNSEPEATESSEHAASSAKKFYPAIQGLRGLSAISVFFLHVYLMAANGGFPPKLPLAIEQAWLTLGAGVALFFIISGFVIPPSIARHGDLRRFMRDRLLRIMPVFVVIHLTVFTLGPFIEYKWFRGLNWQQYVEIFFTNLTFTALPLGYPLAQLNSWTLTYEWGFYILIAVTWRAAERKLNFLLAINAVIALMICWAFPVCWFLVVGMACYRLKPVLRLNRGLEVILIPVCLAGFYYLASFYDPTGVAVPSQSVVIVLAVIPAAIVFVAALQETSLTAKALSIAPFQFLGKMSYSLYLVHPLAVFPCEILSLLLIRHGFDPKYVFPSYMVLATAATIVASTACYRLVEVRLRDILAGWIRLNTLVGVGVNRGR